MKTICVFILLAMCFFVNAQTTSIIYDRIENTNIKVDGVFFTQTFKTKLIFNDTLSFYYHFGFNDENILGNNKVIGKKLIHHSIFYNNSSKEFFEVVAWPKRRNFLIVDSAKNMNWVYNSQIKTIGGYNCTMAYKVDENYDTTMVWYTMELGLNFGPSRYREAKGVILEVFDQKYSIHLKASKIERTDYIMNFPTFAKRISLIDYRKNKKK